MSYWILKVSHRRIPIANRYIHVLIVPLNYIVLQDDHDHLPDIIDSLQAYLQEVEDTRNDLRYRSEEYGDASDELAKLFLQLEQMGEPKGTLDNIFEKLIMIEVISIYLYFSNYDVNRK